MPAKLKPRLSDRQKINILAKKIIKTETLTSIANAEGVSLPTVSKISPETVSPEILAKATKKAETLLERIERIRDKAMIRLEERLDRDELDGKTLNTTFGIAYDKSRIEQGLATQIIAQPDAVAERLARSLLAGYQLGRADLVEALRASKLLDEAGVSDEVRVEVAARLLPE